MSQPTEYGCSLRDFCTAYTGKAQYAGKLLSADFASDCETMDAALVEPSCPLFENYMQDLENRTKLAMRVFDMVQTVRDGQVSRRTIDITVESKLA